MCCLGRGSLREMRAKSDRYSTSPHGSERDQNSPLSSQRASICAISSVTNTTLLVTYNRIYITMTKLAETPSVGFDFSNYARNQFLGQRLQGIPKGNTFSSPFVIHADQPFPSDLHRYDYRWCHIWWRKLGRGARRLSWCRYTSHRWTYRRRQEL